MKHHFIAFTLISSLVAVACGDASSVDEEEGDLDTAEMALTYGTWVSMGPTFGPCLVLPPTCIVGEQIPAHSGPGTAGGCYNYQCQQLGTWVNMGPTFGPCPVRPPTCIVGEQMPAHSGPGTAGGCYIYQCQ
ncbi:hypothetical protein [Polyangium aurulentum]|uniref:hypothetical protein n=1 Tax=Polyangium aurulentum TaxID=2567896 RepID=UPI0010AED967|nr:hypothetical protein [Polyangium aurulentum]UQA55773.1 hypothetical protein E8A73_031130 [Polyangium aurulentum]